MVQTIKLAHVPPEIPLFVALYRDVENAAYLKEQLLAGNSEFEYAFIDASMIISTKHVLAAAFRAVNDYLNNRLKSRNVHSEIVFCLSSNNNIGEAFRRFGVGDTTRNLLVIKVGTNASLTVESVTKHLSESITGTELPLNDQSLKSMSDVDRIKKVYKLGSLLPAKPNGAAQTEMDATKVIEMQVIGLMALRGAT